VRAVHGTPGEALLAPDVARLREAARVYRGDLLEGWHQDWCLLARERLQTTYLGVLNKLMASAEAHDDFESGLLYGHAVLGHDRAHERTHRRLMRLQYLAGDRTAALRQYQQCVDALHEELAVKPSRHTVLLYEQIKNDDLGNVDASDATHAGLARELLSQLRVVRAGLAEFERQLLSGLDG
jgi:DNA-binding SARP family transcriptional activator